VEIDETYVGGEEEGARGRQTQDKALVAIAAEEDGAGIGRIRMKRITRASQPQLHAFLEEAVEPSSIVHTGGWESYVGTESLGYRHEYDFVAGSGQTASALLPRVHRVASLLKRRLLGTHQGSVSREHLDCYLDEFTFRFNRRRSRQRGKLFYRLVEQAGSVAPAPYGEIVRRPRRGRPQHIGWSGVKCIPQCARSGTAGGGVASYFGTFMELTARLDNAQHAADMASLRMIVLIPLCGLFGFIAPIHGKPAPWRDFLKVVSQM
jgi:transposase-like protein